MNGGFIMQQTSLDSYRRIIPQLGERQRSVFKAFAFYGRKTDLEIANLLGKDANFVRPRRNELVRVGLMERCPARKCSVSGRMAITWRVV
jgi:hypothetical protein